MTISFAIENDFDRFLRSLDKRFGTQMASTIPLGMAEFVAGEIRRQVRAWTSKTGSRKTGALARSFKPVILKRFTQTGEGIDIGILSDLPYAWIHEVGGVIKPRLAKALTIPITPMARRRAAKDWSNLKLIHHPPALPILATVRGGKIKPQYILKNRVYITPKRYLTRAANRVEPKIEKFLLRAIKKAIQGAGQDAKK
jgi:hypothetical protein